MLDSLVQTLTTVITAAGGTGVILYFVLKHTMKPIDAYLVTKGKNLATHEDIAKLVDQVRETEKVKAEITDNVWDRQQRWTFKQKIYRELIESLNALYHAEILYDETTADPISKTEKAAAHEAKMTALAALKVFDTLTTVSAIVVSTEALGIIRNVAGSYGATPSEDLGLLKAALEDLSSAARKDLGY